MTDYKKEFFKIMSDDSYGIICAPTDPATGYGVLCEYLLPKGWYSCSGGGAEQINTEIIHTILMKHSREYRKDFRAWRRRVKDE